MNERHGYVRTKVYRTWHGMKARCYNQNNQKYPDYGGRGIKVVKRWREKFENFLEDMGEPPSKNHSIDRINNNGNYCKSNCRWATIEQQANNKRNNRIITYNGKTQTLPRWARETGIDRRTIMKRIGYGWSLDKVFTKVNYNKQKEIILTFNGKTQNASSWAKELGLDSETIYKRIKDGFSIEKILYPGNLPKQNVVYLEFNGKNQSLLDWSRELGIKKTTLFNRYKSGLSINKILSKTNFFKDNFIMLTFNKKTQSLSDWSRELKINRITLNGRLRKGFPVEQILSTRSLRFKIKSDNPITTGQ